MHLFLSYSRQDSVYVLAIKNRLEEDHFMISIDDEILKPGHIIARELSLNIYNCSCFIVFITPNSINSKWVNAEIELAIKCEKVVIPILLIGNSIPLTVAQYLWLDFRTLELSELNYRKLTNRLRDPEFKQINNNREIPIIEEKTIPPPANQNEKYDHLSIIKSPMIGTFYRSSWQDRPPFVKIGDKIEPGTKVCIIEAMKLVNEIESDVKGKIVKILVEDGNPVEYEQPLFLVDPA